MLKNIHVFIGVLSLIQGCSLINPKNDQYDSYECQGNFKTMFLTLPTNFKIKDDYLTLKYTGDLEIIEGLEEKYKFNLLHANGVQVERINSNEISFKAIGVDGTLLLKECELHLPVETQLSEKFFEILPTLSIIFNNMWWF